MANIAFANVLAIHGPAVRASATVSKLQRALNALASATKDPSLRVQIDGVMGPRTAAATNHALTTYVGAGMNLQVILAPADISARIDEITAVITAAAVAHGRPPAWHAIQHGGSAALVPTRSAAAALPSMAPGPAASAGAAALAPAPGGGDYQPVPPQHSFWDTFWEKWDNDSTFKYAVMGLGGILALGIVAHFMAPQAPAAGPMLGDDGLGELPPRLREDQFRLMKLPANQAWALIWGQQIIQVGDNPRLFRTHAEAVEALRYAGLRVDQRNVVTAGG